MTTPFEHRSVSLAGSLILWLCLSSSSLAAGPKQNSDDKAFGEFVAAEQQLAGRLFESLLRENLAGNTAVAPYCLFESLGLLETANLKCLAGESYRVVCDQRHLGYLPSGRALYPVVLSPRAG